MCGEDAAETMRRIVGNLEGEYGRKIDTRSRDVLDELVFTILSQQNSSVSTRSVFAELKGRFPTWADVDAAETADVEAAIRRGGLARMKALRIKEIVAAIRAERGSFDMSFLEGVPADEALDYLTRFKGVGPKTARCTLLFALGKAVFPMDVHIFRILQRVGLLDPKWSDERAHRAIAALVPTRKHYGAHMNLIAHGRKICRPTAPRCDECCIVDYCPFGQERLSNDASADPRVR